MERLAAGESILCAEGYLLELARMGYLAHGVWVPEFILEAPEVLESVHKMFVHCGSDVTEAFQVCVNYMYTFSMLLKLNFFNVIRIIHVHSPLSIK